MGRGSPVPVQMWAEGGPSRGADVTRVGPVPVQTWQRRAQPIPVQMWPNERALARQYFFACTFPGPLPWPFLSFFPLPRPPPPKANGAPTSVICEAVPLDLGTASRAARRSVSVRNPSADVACAAAVSAQPRGGREAVPPTSCVVCVCVCDRARVCTRTRVNPCARSEAVQLHLPCKPAWKRALCVCARVLDLGVSGMGGVSGDPPSTRSLNQSTVQNGRTSDLRAKRYSTRQPDETRGPRAYPTYPTGKSSLPPLNARPPPPPPPWCKNRHWLP